MKDTIIYILIMDKMIHMDKRVGYAKTSKMFYSIVDRISQKLHKYDCMVDMRFQALTQI